MRNEITNVKFDESSVLTKIGKILIDQGKITAEQFNVIVEKQKSDGLKFGEAAIALGFITKDDLNQVLALQFDYEVLPAVGRFNSNLCIAYNPYSAVSEAIRSLRTQITLRWINQGFKSFSVVSANEGEGKSFIATNLAVAFSQVGKKTLLIDANLRTPVVDKIFGCSVKVGLSDILVGRLDGVDTFPNISEFSNLSVLVAGSTPPNPQELLLKNNLNVLLKYAAEAYDVIIVDTPSMISSTDAQIIASKTNGAVIVTRQNMTAINDIEFVKGQLNSADSAIIGAIVNNF